MKIQLLKFLSLKGFPSGSAFTWYEEKLYLVGDDATHLLILDKNYEPINSITLFNHPEKRIPKPLKADLEASTLIKVKGKDHLLVLGSASREERKKVILILLVKSDRNEPSFREYYTGEFVSRLISGGIKEINFEGVTTLEDHMVLATRGHAAYPKNHLIVTNPDFWERQKETPVSFIELLPFAHVSGFIGVSDLFYLKSNNVLLVTLSSEATTNSYEDGAIGNSYLGWIKGVTQKINNPEVALDGLINLTDVSPEFIGEKIEGICVESVTRQGCIIHLVSDNDQGESKLFKIKMGFQRMTS